MIFLIKLDNDYFYLYEYVYDINLKKNCQIYKILSENEIILNYDNGKILKNGKYMKNLIKIKK
jgi:hypothetical protein